MDLELHPVQAEAFMSPATELLFGGAAGGGKALAVDTPVPTPRGWATMGQLVAGDEVFGADGRPCRVVAVTEHMHDHACYRVEFCDGQALVADAGHLWRAYSDADREALRRVTDEFRAARRAKRERRGTGARPDLAEANSRRAHAYRQPPSGRVVSTEHMAGSVMRGPRHNWFVELCPGIRTPAVDLPIPPYVLGVWLGDGTRGQGAVTTADAQIVEELEREGYELRKRPAHRYAWGVMGLQRQLGELGVLRDKHIPVAYLRASEEQRMELLRGLMDTDGTVNKGGQCEFDNCDLALMRGAHELVSSLGIKARISTGVARLNGKDCGPKYRMKFTTTKQVFRLQRKRDRLPTVERGTQAWRVVRSVSPVDSVPVRCIQVDSADGMFLVGEGMVPTHNSHLLRIVALATSCEIPYLQTYLFRRLSTDLYKNHMEGPTGFEALCAPLFAKKFARINYTENYIAFANGAKIHLCHCQFDKDKIKYQGPEIHQLLVDELTHFTWPIYTFLRGRVRLTKGMKIPEKYKGRFPRIMAGSNPGGIGHTWVKHAFIDQQMPRTIWRTPRNEGGMLRQYIPAKLSDNPSLDAEEYGAILSGLGSDELVRAMRDGDWDIVAGGMFDDVWSRDTHVLDNFAIPPTWSVDRVLDWGSAKPFAVVWFAESDGTPAVVNGEERWFAPGTLVAFDEWYGWDGRPNTGCRKTASEVADGIREREQWMTRRVMPGPADTSIYDSSMGRALSASRDGPASIAEAMEQRGVLWIPGNKSRVSGAERIRDRLRNASVNPREYPGLFFSSKCQHCIRTIPVLPRDQNRDDDVDTDAEDHCLHGDTLVAVAGGARRIRDLVDTCGLVRTVGGGWARYSGVRRTRRSAPVIRVSFASGATLVCTPDHGVLASGGRMAEAGFLVDAVRYAGVCGQQEGEPCVSKSVVQYKNSKVLDTICAGSISSVRECGCTGLCGNGRTACLCPQGMTCIISTGIGATIARRILSLCHAALTWGYTLFRGLMRKTGAESASRRAMQQNGMGATRGEHGTESTMLGSRMCCTESTCCAARSVEDRTKVSEGSSARMRANPQQEEQGAKITLREYAPYVEPVLWRTGILPRELVRGLAETSCETWTSDTVVAIADAGVADVYCMTVEEVSCFMLESGHIVSNCYDAVRYRVAKGNFNTGCDYA